MSFYPHIWCCRTVPSTIKPRWLVKDTAVQIANLFNHGVAETIVDYMCPLSPSVQDVVESGSWEACMREPCLSQGLFHASRLGNRPLMNLFIRRGACCWSEAFCGALIGGQLEIAKSFRGKMGCVLPFAFASAAFASGKKEVVAFVQSLGERSDLCETAQAEAHCGWTPLLITPHTVFSSTVHGALEGGHLELAQWFQARANYTLAADVCTVYWAFVGGNASCIEWVQKEHGLAYFFWADALIGACNGGHILLAKLANSHLAKPLSSDFISRLLETLAECFVHDTSLFREFFLEHAEIRAFLQDPKNCHDILRALCKTGKVDLLDFLFPKLPSGLLWCQLGYVAANCNQIRVLMWLKQKGLVQSHDRTFIQTLLRIGSARQDISVTRFAQDMESQKIFQ